MLYEDSSCLLTDDGTNKIVKLLTTDEPLYVHTDVHAVKVGNGHYWRVYSFDSFINHSCEPNSMACNETEDADTAATTFTTIATRNIHRGEEITTDYDSFIYSYPGIPQCQCRSELCRGYSLGFVQVPRAAQEAMLHRTHPEVIAAWLNDNPQVCYCPVTLSPGVKLRTAAGPRESDNVITEMYVSESVAAGTAVLTSLRQPVHPRGAMAPTTCFIALHNPWVRVSQEAEGGSASFFEPLLGEDVSVINLDIRSQKLSAEVSHICVLQAIIDKFRLREISSLSLCNCVRRGPSMTPTQRTRVACAADVKSAGGALGEASESREDPLNERDKVAQLQQAGIDVLVATVDIPAGEVLRVSGPVSGI